MLLHVAQLFQCTFLEKEWESPGNLVVVSPACEGNITQVAQVYSRYCRGEGWRIYSSIGKYYLKAIKAAGKASSAKILKDLRK